MLLEKEGKHQEVINYYNEHVQHKLNDYINVNPRIEAAWTALLAFAPESPLNILEVGCGIGGIAYRLSRRWTSATVRGIDISTQSIQIAEKLFSGSRTQFKSGVLKPDTYNEQFDLIVLMDVYEHISVEDRAEVHAALKKLLRNKGRIFVSIPTPHYLKWLKKNKPENIQPVDEHITMAVIEKLAADTATEVIMYQRKDIWSRGDYAHFVLERNDDFEASFFASKPVSTIERFKRGLNKVIYRLGSTTRRSFVKSKLKG
jgi:2-polyprenyl-3-methyl-5-hydroxy-6-metoxy-1,4-benzoquinol methylase